MTREETIQASVDYFASGQFRETLARRVAFRTESQEADSGPVLTSYLTDEMIPALQALGFECMLADNPIDGKGPFLLARRMEPEAKLTLLTYGHGDVVRGYDSQWRSGLSPWEVVQDGNVWYGRGTADNKGQHTVNLAALGQVLKARAGRLGYNVKLILEMGEEDGSPGLDEICVQYRDWLAADLFIASDGPRISAARPTLFLGSRGVFNFELQLNLRDGAHHSGNWGGLLSNPGIRLAHAIASIVDAHGRILVPGLRPPTVSDAMRRILADIELGGGATDPQIDPGWGEPGLSAAEKVYGWNTLDVLAFVTGNPDKPAHAIPPRARANCHMRYVVGSDVANFSHHLRRHLDANGFEDVEVVNAASCYEATRLDPADPWVEWGMASISRSADAPAAVLPNFGGGLPNACFSKTLGLPTLWVPHSYPACSQHAPNEHILVDMTLEALKIMTGLFWDLSEQGAEVMRKRTQLNKRQSAEAI
ncbi:M20 family metallopeptidase [Affinibrenneria salicis]|uniref:M20 family metallopeptidase n=1 Tax=Affinibrenneria salicis TaxID=2590031 RepID=A0A5J5FRQ7_9GAMM|nr:M20 family metallopeptidase [Affinibrenneria salicis]KAA8995175.1 M20 family metallopeptidase [Affinibrenneria salicis]